LRQGVIYDLQERMAALQGAEAGHDLRDDSVLALQQRFGVDTAQALRVQTLALKLYADFQPRAHPDTRAEVVRELGWAAALHELGMMVSHHDHHRHSAYLLAHVDAAGFSQSQQRRLAALVLGQRGGLRKVEDSLRDEVFAWQVMSLRLAVLLCHARQAPAAKAIKARRVGRSAAVSFDAQWAAEHPRSVYLLNEEKTMWERADTSLRLALQD
jgi:exopolyphosphatase / guanosine-5'-triphosphate,3'-diphosphate pyrophosphatase